MSPPPDDPREFGPFVWRREDGVEVSTDPSRLDNELVYRFISTSYWATAMPRPVLERAIRHSLCFGLYMPDGRQAGFARVITDRSTYAYLSDVFIVEEHRATGLGRYLIECVLGCAALQGLRRFSLFTRDADALYAPFGFGPFSGASHYMEIRNAGVYAAPRATSSAGRRDVTYGASSASRTRRSRISAVNGLGISSALPPSAERSLSASSE